MPETTVKVCKYHGETEFIYENRGYYRCRKCRSEAVIKRRRNVKLILIEEFGGKCKLCGYNKCANALQFHHIDPSKKEFIIGHGNTINLEKVREEAKKCMLLCANCHFEIHANIAQ